MKFLKILMMLALTASSLVFFSSCSDDPTSPNYSELVVGKWIVTEVDGVGVLTDSAFCMELRSDKVEVYSIGTQIDLLNSKWVEGRFQYTIDDDQIIVDGTDIFNKTHHVAMKILNISATELKYSVVSYAYDGVSIPDASIYTCKKATVDYSSKIVGVWYGKCTSANTSDTTYHYWEYFADGKYNYYYQNATNAWLKKSDNDGGYFLYGSLFASNYHNDLIGEHTGITYECWDISIANDKMIWTGKRLNNKTVVYEMEKRDAPPATL